MKKDQLISIIGMFAIGMLLILMIAHSLCFLEMNCRYKRPWFGWTHAVGLDLAIFVFTIKDWLKTALIYMFITFAHNLAYLFALKSAWNAVLLKVIPSVTLFSFTPLFFRHPDNENTPIAIAERLLKMEQATRAGVIDKALPHKYPEFETCFAANKQRHYAPHIFMNTIK